jgi:signal peptidase II
LIFAGVAAAMLALDQWTKFWALEKLAPSAFAEGVKALIIVPGLLRFEYAENTGAAFSLFTGHAGVLVVTRCIVSLAIMALAVSLPPKDRLAHVAIGFLLSGAIGNIIDGVRYGFVVDFIVAHWGMHAWPTFNVADSCICIGFGLFGLSFLFAYRQEKKQASAA